VGGEKIEPKILTKRLVTPHPERLAYVQYALRQGHTVKQVAKMTSMIRVPLSTLKKLTISNWKLEKHRSSRFRQKCCAIPSAWDSPMDALRKSGRLEGQEKIRHLRKKHGVCVMPSTSASTPARLEFEKLHALPVLDLRR